METGHELQLPGVLITSVGTEIYVRDTVKRAFGFAEESSLEAESGAEGADPAETPQQMDSSGAASPSTPSRHGAGSISSSSTPTHQQQTRSPPSVGGSSSEDSGVSLSAEDDLRAHGYSRDQEYRKARKLSAAAAGEEKKGDRTAHCSSGAHLLPMRITERSQAPAHSAGHQRFRQFDTADGRKAARAFHRLDSLSPPTLHVLRPLRSASRAPASPAPPLRPSGRSSSTGGCACR